MTYNRVFILVGRNIRHLRLETITSYLPNYFDFIDLHHVNSTDLAELLCTSSFTSKAFRYLFDYLEEIDLGCHTSTALSERLQEPWDSLRHGPNERRILFKALGHILHRDMLGCNRKLRSIMTAHVIRNCADIVRGQMDGWIDYVNALDGMGTDRTEMAQVLSCIINEFEESYWPFPDQMSYSRLSPDIQEILRELLSERKTRQCHARQRCERCEQRWALANGDWRMIRPQNIYDDQRFHEYRLPCRDCALRKPFGSDRIREVLESRRAMVLIENEMRKLRHYVSPLYREFLLRR